MERRKLDLPDLTAVVRDAEHLLRVGYDRVGQWTLGQTATHLSVALEGSARGVKLPAPLFVKIMARLFMKRSFFRSRSIPPGLNAPKGTEPPASVDDAAGVQRLSAAVKEFRAARDGGKLGSHPFFGPLNAQEWEQFHTIHSAHHLSFLIPKQKPTA